jgi:hypothetical protein
MFLLMYRFALTLIVLLLWSTATPFTWAAEDEFLPADVLTDAEWDEVNMAVERGLAWLASQQQRDGSFPTMPQGQPAV